MEICCDVDKMIGHRDLRHRFESDTPDPAVIEALRAISEPITVAIVHGFWCPDCIRLVPGVLKALKVADNPLLQPLIASVPLEETFDLPMDVGTVSVRRFPTVAFLRGHYKTTDAILPECEVLRFVEEPLDATRLKIDPGGCVVAPEV